MSDKITATAASMLITLAEAILFGQQIPWSLRLVEDVNKDFRAEIQVIQPLCKVVH